MNYTTLNESSCEVVISRSRFLAFAYPVAGEDDVTAKLKELRKKYHDATHVCYAAVFDEAGSMTRSSDDGEPSGTAGAPILDVIRGAGLSKCLVAVVRYFGGIKLGTGGLTKAYSSTAADCVARATKVEYVLSDIYKCTTDYNTFRRIGSWSGISDVEYSSEVSFVYACPVGGDVAPLVDRANGKIAMSLVAQEYKKNTDAISVKENKNGT